ncbi:MAG TPA: hypothetical protein VNA20_00120 [Frankiaceae bacterium]|nr:hypothetical protein [Frankiaceae bacterium]
MATKDERVLEVVVFGLNAGVTSDQLLATVDGVTAWAAERPGFVSRDLYAAGDRWVDVVRWRTLADAESAAVAAESSERCAPMFGLIDMGSVLMLHGQPVTAPVAAGTR